MLKVHLTFSDKEKAEVQKLKNVLNNTDAKFGSYIPKFTKKNMEIVRRIEQGTLNDNGTFTDRFNRPLFFENLSIGCKTAIILSDNLANGEIVNLDECGINARDVILNMCDGEVILPDIQDEVEDFGYQVDIHINNRIFNNISELNHYIFNERIVEE